MQAHLGCCSRCSEYLYDGDGDLCDDGKQIIVREFAYADTAPHDRQMDIRRDRFDDEEN
jgi:hypothetical protein